MDFDRRHFMQGAGVVLGALGCGDIAGAQEARDGHTPMTRAEWDRMIRGTGHEPFTCIQTPAMTEGPFYYETSLERRSLAEGRSGEALRLGIKLAGIGVDQRCEPLAGAVIDVWHTDASGLYSNVGTDLQPVDTIGQTFLRGHQFTDDDGYAEFDTIVPGWEIIAAAPPVIVSRRTTHIHVKAYHGRDVLTTQLFFADALTDQLYSTTEPYRSHAMLTAPGLDRAYPRIRNDQDPFFPKSGSTPMTVERINGVLTAKATIGVMGGGRPGMRPLFR
jgi:protocatechuate 3,4-dioxygenase beta subunit